MGAAEGLDVEQQRAVLSDARVLCVLAGAGSGKTRVLTRRVAYRIESGAATAEHSLVLTFTRKAATELRERLEALGVEGVTAGTFHSIAYAQLRQRYVDAGKTMPAVVASPLRLVDQVLEEVRLNRALPARGVVAEIAWAKSHGLTPETYEDGLEKFRHRVSFSHAHMRKAYEAYEWQKKKRHLLDYEDLLLSLTIAMRSDRRFAESQRWRFRHFYVDEFQDLNRAQFDLLNIWMQRPTDDADLFLVGDVNQSIYGWNGADSSLLRNISAHLPGIETMHLQRNYRSTSHVLAAAHAVLDAGQELVDVTNSGVPPVVRVADDERAEAELVARAVRQVHRDHHRWRDIAVLVRTNAQRSTMEEAFLRLGVPFQATGGAAWLSVTGVRAAIEELRGFAKARLEEHAPDIEAMVAEAGDDARHALGELATAARVCLEESPFITVADFLAWVEVTYRFDAPMGNARADGAVTITTFHRAKGLEWPVVFLAGVEDGFVPLGSPEGTALDEERRLFYVAITRAQEQLHLSWARQRTTSRGTQQRVASPWLAALMASGSAIEAVDLSDDLVHNYLDQGRSALHFTAAQVDATRQRLDRWRSARAKLTGIRAEVILSDSAIDEIMRLQPASIEELAKVSEFGRVRAVSSGESLLACLRETEAAQ